MQIIGCGKGHYYNPELYSSCPECAKENRESGFACAADAANILDDANKFSAISATELLEIHNAANKFSDIAPAAFLDFDDSVNICRELSVTEPVEFRGFEDKPGEIGATEPAIFHGFGEKSGEIGATEPATFHGFGEKSSEIGATEPVTFHGFDEKSSEIGATEPATFHGFDEKSGEIGATEPVTFHGFDEKSNEISVTEPAAFHDFSGRSKICATEPVDRDVFVDMPKDFTVPVDMPHSSNAQEYGVTMPIIPAGMDSNTSDGALFMPVVGWLVCIEGIAKGQDYRIHSHYNFIGRGDHMDICISGDACISADRAAVIAYDPEENYFSFGPGMGHNIVRVNGKMLMNAVVLNAYDELTIGNTKLLFVPLCGKEFSWSGK